MADAKVSVRIPGTNTDITPRKAGIFTEVRVEKFEDGVWARTDHSPSLTAQINEWVDSTGNMIEGISTSSSVHPKSDHLQRFSVHNAVVTYLPAEQWVNTHVGMLTAAIFAAMPERVAAAFTEALKSSAVTTAPVEVAPSESESESEDDIVADLASQALT